MGYSVSGIIIDSLPQIGDVELLNKRVLKTKFKRTSIAQLRCPQLSISFKEGKTIILLDMIFYRNVSEDASLTELEQDLNAIFPNSGFMIFSINDTVNFACFSLVDMGMKLRTKGVANDEVFLDYGELLPIELSLYKDILGFLEKDSKSYEILEQKFAAFDDLEKKKRYIMFRDRMFIKSGASNVQNYTDGSLDSWIIERILKSILDCDLNHLEELYYIQFDRRRLNFKKDSLREYLYLATNEWTEC